MAPLTAAGPQRRDGRRRGVMTEVASDARSPAARGSSHGRRGGTPSDQGASATASQRLSRARRHAIATIMHQVPKAQAAMK